MKSPSNIKATGIAAAGGAGLGYLESTIKGYLPESMKSPMMFGLVEILAGHFIKKKNEKLGLAIAAIGGYQIGRGFKEGNATTKGLTMPGEVYDTKGMTMPGEVYTAGPGDNAAWGNVFGAASPQTPVSDAGELVDAGGYDDTGELVDAGDAMALEV